MAASSAQLLSQLNKKFSSSEIELSEKLQVARSVFTSSIIPLHRKEEIVIQKLCELILPIDGAVSWQTCECLLECLQSPRMISLPGDIRPSVTELLLSVLGKTGKMTDRASQPILRQCIVAVLESPYYQRWLSRDIKSLALLIQNYFSCPHESSLIEEYSRVCQLILTIFKSSLLKEEFRSWFISRMFTPMIKCFVDLEKDDVLSPFNVHLYTNVIQVVFYDPCFTTSVIEDFRLKTEVEDTGIIQLMKLIRKLPSNESFSIVSKAYTVLMMGVMQTMQDKALCFQFFVNLCYSLGLVIHKLRSVTVKPLKNMTREESFVIIAQLVRVLDEHNMPISCELREISLQNWFTGCVICLVSLNEMSEELLNLVAMIYDFDPLVQENSLKATASIMLRPKKPDMMDSYINFIQSVVRAAVKLHRLPKFLNKFLSQMQEDSVFQPLPSDGSKLTHEDVIPEKVSQLFTDATKSLTRLQILPILKSLLDHFQLDYLNRIENPDLPVDDTAIATYILVEILCSVLKGVRIHDTEAPDVVKEKFASTLKELEDLLARLSSAIVQRPHEDLLLRGLLKLCHDYGSIQMEIQERDCGTFKDLEPLDLIPVNLSYLHPYIPPNQWDIIAKRIEGSKYVFNKDLFYSLLIQKMEAVSPVEVGEEGPGTLTGRYILEHARISWYWSKGLSLARLVETKELFIVVAVLVKASKHNRSLLKSVLLSEKFLSDRRLALATALIFLKSLAAHVHKNKKKGSLCKRITDDICLHTVLEYDLSQLHLENSENHGILLDYLKTVSGTIQATISMPNNYAGCENLCLTTDAEVFGMIPVQHFGTLSQSTLAMTIIALLYDTPPEHGTDEHLFNILYSFLVGPKKIYTDLFLYIEAGTLIKFICERGASYSKLKYLLEKLFQLCITCSVSAQQAFKHVKSPKKETIWMTAMLISCLAKLKKKRYSDGTTIPKTVYVAKLLAAISPFLISEPHTRELLPVYALAMKLVLRQDDSKVAERLSPKLLDYIQLAMDHFDDGAMLIEAVTKHKRHVTVRLPTDMYEKIIGGILDRKIALPGSEFMDSIFNGIPAIDLIGTVTLTLTKTAEVIKAMDSSGIERVFAIWQIFLTSMLSNEKERIRQEALIALMPPISLLVQKWNSHHEVVNPLLETLSALGRTTTVPLKPQVLDFILEILAEVPSLTCPNDREKLVHISLALDVLFSIYFFRTTFMIDRIPVLLQKFRLFLGAVAEIVSKSRSDDYLLIDRAQSCARKLEKGAATMVKRRKDFARLSPYIIADILSILERHNVMPSVKVHFTNCMNEFLSVCDEHGISYLSSNLPSTTKEMFKILYDHFKKFHRYEGKV